MKYSLRDLIDTERLQELTDALHEATSIPSSIIDASGRVLTGSGWQRICTEFHRRHPDIEAQCIESDVLLRKRVGAGEPFTVYECPMGLVDACAPIVIEGEHLGNVFCGQVFLAPPDETVERRFREQARRFGLDEASYLEAFRAVPVFRPEEFRAALRFLAKLAELVATLGLMRKREIEASAAEAARRRVLFEQSPDGILVIDPVTMSFLEFNAAAHRQLGYTREEFAALRITDVEAQETTEETRARVDSVLQDGIADFETRQRAKTGEIRHVHVTAQTVEVGGQILYHCIWRDITDRARAEAAVRESEARLARIFETVPDGITIVDAGGQVTFANAAAERILGLSRDEITSRTYNTPAWRIAAVDGGPFPDEGLPVARVLRSGEPVQNVVHAIERPDGARTILSVNAAPLRDPAGRISSVVASITDITEQQGVARALAESERKFATLFAEASMPSALSRLPDYRVEDVNEAWLQLFGYRKDEVVGKTSLEIGVSRDAEARRHLMDELLLHGQVRGFEQTAYTKAGEALTVVSNINLITIGGQEYAITSVQDVTDRKRAEQALQESEDHLRFALETSRTGAWDLDLVGHTAFRSVEHDRIFGYGDLLPKWTYEMFLEHVLPEDRERVDAAFQHATDTGGDWSFECRIRRADGETRWILAAGRHRPGSSGKPRRLAGIVRDITERKRAEEALRESNELLSAFINHSPIYAFVKEVRPGESKVLTASENFEEMVGIPGSKMAGMTMEQIFPPEFAAKITADDWAVASAGDVLRLDEDLGDRHYTTIKFPIKVGSRTLLAGYTIDITDRKRAEVRLQASEAELRRLLEVSDQSRRALLSIAEDQRLAEEALRASEERYRLISENSSDVIWLLDLPELRFSYVSPSVSRLRGFTPEEVIGQPIEAALTPESAATLKTEIPKLLAAFVAGDESVRTQVREIDQPRKDGTVVHTEVVSTLLTDADNRPSRILGVTRDITARKLAEAALRESERRYQTLAESSPVGIFRTDEAGATTYVNRRWCEIAGITVEEALGDGWMRAVHPDDRGALASGWDAARSRSFESTAEYRLVRPDGAIAWVMGRAVPEVDGSGNVVGYVGTITDITERKQAEQALAESEARYRSLLQVAPIGIAVHQGGKVVFANTAGARLLGAEHPDAIIGRSIQDFIHPDGLHIAESRIRRMLAGETGLYPAEDVHMKLDGTPINVEVMATPLHYEGKPAVQVIVTDVTERKRTEAALRRERDFTAGVLNSLPGVVYCYDESYRFLRWNANFESVTGYSSDEVARQSPLDYFAGDDKDVLAARIQEVFERGSSAVEAAFVTKDGTRIPYFFTGVRTEIEGERCLVGVGLDISERKRVEDERSRLLDQVRGLASRVVDLEEAERKRLARELHDRVGQTLTALGLNLSMIKSSLGEARTAPVETLISDSLGLLGGATEQVRDVMADLRPPVLDDYGLVAALHWQVERFAARTGISAEVAGDDLTPRPEIAVELVLFRAVQEALTNVAKHARARRASVSVRQEGGTVRIEVVDDGVGFDADPGARGERPPGWGIVGMRERVEAVGGRVEVKSAAGSGTRVIIELGRPDDDRRSDRGRPRRRS